jgi:putative flippase GtrA
MRIVRFLAAGFATFLIDNGTFYVIYRSTSSEFLAIVAATALAVSFNYVASRHFVFTSGAQRSVEETLPKYVGLHATGLLIRYGIIKAAMAVFHLPSRHWGVYAAKLAADGVVYSLKYVIQRDYVFRDR